MIICGSAGREEVRDVLGSLEERIVVAAYRHTSPSEAAIGARLGHVGDLAAATEADADEPREGD